MHTRRVPFPAMQLSSEEQAACSEMPSPSDLRGIVCMAYPVMETWRRDKCTVDRIDKDIMTDMGTGELDVPRDDRACTRRGK